MKQKLAILGISLLLCSIFPVVTQAQYFKFTNAQSQTDVELQVEGILKFFDSLVGGGMFHTADLHSVGGFDLGMTGVVASVPDDLEGLPTFSEENLLGLAFLQGSLGLPGNFELLGRFFYLPIGSDTDLNASPPRAADSRGGVRIIGGGLKYGLIQMPGLPKVMVMGAFHTVSVPSDFDFGTVNTLSFKAVASHSIPLLSFYVGAGVDITTLKLSSDFDGDLFGLEGDRFTESLPHVTLGVKVKPLPLLHVTAAYNVSDFASLALGVGVSLR
ncbi:hypothetical protein MJD09_01965 [bacterium]|nr:hypothetical protein [bacterium]